MIKEEEKPGIMRRISVMFGNLFDVSGHKGYKKFLFFLILIDLAWFSSVVSDNLFGMNLQDYGEFAWVFFFSLGMIIISDLKKIKNMRRMGIRADNFACLVTLIIGLMALVVSILSLPQFDIVSPIMSSVKGIIALIAIVYVILEAIITEKEQ